MIGNKSKLKWWLNFLCRRGSWIPHPGFFSVASLSLSCFLKLNNAGCYIEVCRNSHRKHFRLTCFQSPFDLPPHSNMQTLVVTHSYCFMLNLIECCKHWIKKYQDKYQDVTARCASEQNAKIATLYYKAWSSIHFVHRHVYIS